MIKLDELFDMWKKDCQIDENNLDAAKTKNENKTRKTKG